MADRRPLLGPLTSSSRKGRKLPLLELPLAFPEVGPALLEAGRLDWGAFGVADRRPLLGPLTSSSRKGCRLPRLDSPLAFPEVGSALLEADRLRWGAFGVANRRSLLAPRGVCGVPRLDPLLVFAEGGPGSSKAALDLTISSGNRFRWFVDRGVPPLLVFAEGGPPSRGFNERGVPRLDAPLVFAEGGPAPVEVSWFGLDVFIDNGGLRRFDDGGVPRDPPLLFVEDGPAVLDAGWLGCGELGVADRRLFLAFAFLPF